MTTDPVIETIAAANPVDRSDFVDRVPPFQRPQPPPLRLRRRIVTGVAAGALIALAAFIAVALQPARTPGGRTVLERAFARDGAASTIFSWRMTVQRPQVADVTFDAWMRMTPSGTVDRVHQRGVSGVGAGVELVVDQPGGAGDPRGAVTRDRQAPGMRIRTTPGQGGVDAGITAVLTALNRKRELGSAHRTTLGGRPAYALDLGTTSGPSLSGRHPGAPLPVTLWVDRATGAPLQIRVGVGADQWLLERVTRFERLPDDASHRALLDFSRAGA